jgi:putative transposase
MRTGRPKKREIVLQATEREPLEALARSRSLPHGAVRRAQMVLCSAGGHSTTAIAKRFRVTAPTVNHWRNRFLDFGLAGLYGEARPGRPRTHDDERVAALIQKTLHSRPKGATHWSVRSIARETKIPKTTVHRYFTLFGLQPHRQKTFKLSTDPFFVEKVRDIVGLYLNPPDNALVLCVDEKSQIQALQRSQPLLPLGFGYVEGVTHDYFRHGTTTLFAALDAASGRIIAQCKRRHRHQEFLSFLNHLDRDVPKDLDVHLIVDNYATHKHAKVRAWLAARPRYHLHYTPTYASWLNQVERWFGLITQQAIRRGSFQNVPELVNKIDLYVQHYNLHTRPFVWTATADSILAKLERLCIVINGTSH